MLVLLDKGDQVDIIYAEADAIVSKTDTGDISIAFIDAPTGRAHSTQLAPSELEAIWDFYCKHWPTPPPF